jgi:predicted transcriptional regulator
MHRRSRGKECKEEKVRERERDGEKRGKADKEASKLSFVSQQMLMHFLSPSFLTLPFLSDAGSSTFSQCG